MSTFLLSVVIPCFNGAKYLRECLESVRQSKRANVEFIFMDGLSKDDSVAIAREYSDVLDHIVSERDTGQSDAFNKGFKLAKGKYLTWLNCDDVFVPGSIDTVLEYLAKGESQWYAANSVYLGPDSSILRCCCSGGFESLGLRFGVLDVFGPSTIFHRDLFARMGDFLEDYHYCMDTEYWWRLAAAGVRYKRIPVYLWALRLHEEAKTASAITDGFSKRPLGMQREGAAIWQQYYPQLRSRRPGGVFARAWRTLNGAYFRGMTDTLRFRGRNINDCRFN